MWSLQRGNLFGEPEERRKRRRPRPTAPSSTNVSDIPAHQQVNDIHEFLQSLTSSLEVNSSTNITDINSSGSNSPSHSVSIVSVRSSELRQNNINSSRGQIITIPSDDEEFSKPQLSGPTQEPAARGEPSVSTPIWEQESYGPFLPTSEEARAGDLPPLPASQQPDVWSGPPAGARSRGAAGGANLGGTPRSRKTTINKTSSKKKSVRPTLSIVFIRYN